jgi:hypothetical protein
MRIPAAQVNLMENPYAPPAMTTPVSIASADATPPSKPIIPAVIGMFTYGSTSPYSLVLCVEQYLEPCRRPIPWSTHIATVLAIFGSVGWLGMNLVYCSETFDLLLGKPTTMYAQIGLMVWLASCVFISWALWRVVRFAGRSRPY